MRSVLASLALLLGCSESHALPDAGTDAPFVGAGSDTGIDAAPPDLPDAPPEPFDAACTEVLSASISGRVMDVTLSELTFTDALVNDCVGSLELDLMWSDATATRNAAISVRGGLTARAPERDVDVDAWLWVGSPESTTTMSGTLRLVEGDAVLGPGPLRYRGSFRSSGGGVTATFDFVTCDATACL